MNSTANPKVKTTEREGVGARFLVYTISGVERHVGVLGWD
jgi:hypothetical protein